MNGTYPLLDFIITQYHSIWEQTHLFQCSLHSQKCTVSIILRLCNMVCSPWHIVPSNLNIYISSSLFNSLHISCWHSLLQTEWFTKFDYHLQLCMPFSFRSPFVTFWQSLEPFIIIMPYQIRLCYDTNLLLIFSCHVCMINILWLQIIHLQVTVA